jgi:hypothetical protein
MNDMNNMALVGRVPNGLVSGHQTLRIMQPTQSGRDRASSFSDMVVFSGPVPGDWRSRMLNDKLPSTSAKVNPRGGFTPQWKHELHDAFATAGVSNIVADCVPPSLEFLEAQLSTHGHRLGSIGTLQLYRQIVHEWLLGNNKVYHIVYASINLSGTFNEKDLEYIRQHFWAGDYRDGCGLLTWILSHRDGESISAQAKLHTQVRSYKLKSGDKLEAFELHCNQLLSTWRKIATNKLSEPAQFYFLLSESFPDDVQDASKLGQLKSYLANALVDQKPELEDVVRKCYKSRARER